MNPFAPLPPQGLKTLLYRPGGRTTVRYRTIGSRPTPPGGPGGHRHHSLQELRRQHQLRDHRQYPAGCRQHGERLQPALRPHRHRGQRRAPAAVPSQGSRPDPPSCGDLPLLRRLRQYGQDTTVTIQRHGGGLRTAPSTDTTIDHLSFFGGFKDVTSLVTGNATYSFTGLVVNNSANPWCQRSTRRRVLAGAGPWWSSYTNDGEAYRVINVYDGFQALPEQFHLP